MGEGLPDGEQESGNGTGINDIDEEEGYDDLMVVPEGPYVFFPDVVHEPDIALPDDEGKEDKIGIVCKQFGIGI
jgi:hypothetical protein